MISLTLFKIWRNSAQIARTLTNCYAGAKEEGRVTVAAAFTRGPAGKCLYRYPIPSTVSGPNWVRPFFGKIALFARGQADARLPLISLSDLRRSVVKNSCNLVVLVSDFEKEQRKCRPDFLRLAWLPFWRFQPVVIHWPSRPYLAPGPGQGLPSLPVATPQPGPPSALWAMSLIARPTHLNADPHRLTALRIQTKTRDSVHPCPASIGMRKTRNWSPDHV